MQIRWQQRCFLPEPDYSVVAVVVVGGGLVGAVEAVEDALMRTRKTQAMVLLP
jgi:hypothetical protein